MPTISEISSRSMAILRDRGIVRDGKTTTGDFLKKLIEETGEAEEALITLLHQVRLGVDMANASYNEAGKSFDHLAIEICDIIIACCSTLAFIGKDGDRIVDEKLNYNKTRKDWER